MRAALLGGLAVGLLVEHPVQADVDVEAVHVAGEADGQVAVGALYGQGHHVDGARSEAQGQAPGQAQGRVDAYAWAHGHARAERLGVARAELPAASKKPVVFGGQGLVVERGPRAVEVVQAELVGLFGTAPVASSE